jgi:hypothetical protein
MPTALRGHANDQNRNPSRNTGNDSRSNVNGPIRISA